ncbi:hypothetical protein [Motiliproteus sediminis]|uniref:hypothetical protein n=1 Tax=Motiliproteus sediminis TaxID=1468178 RepID=UPI001AEFCBCB|nr:hypothetical protein [Motiliproteus sediminis]
MKSAADNNIHGHRVRRRKLIDLRLQGWLLLALVVLETAMLVAAMIFLYFRFSAAIEANLFTIHRSAQQPLLPLFLKEMAIVIVTMGVINTLALILANGLWMGHIKRVLAAFRQQLQKVGRLDLTPGLSDPQPEHEVLALLESWRAREVARCERVDELLEHLKQFADSGTDIDPHQLAHWANELDHTLQEVR